MALLTSLSMMSHESLPRSSRVKSKVWPLHTRSSEYRSEQYVRRPLILPVAPTPPAPPTVIRLHSGKLGDGGSFFGSFLVVLQSSHDDLQLARMNSASVAQAPRAAASGHSTSKSLHTLASDAHARCERRAKMLVGAKL